jgi:16S rRNA processing protein RimM
LISFDQLVTIGRAVKPQGRHGELAVEVLTDFPERFDSLRKVFVPGPSGGAREVEVEAARPHKGRMLVKLRGVDSIDAAEAYRGMDLRIAEDDLARLPAGSYYHYQLKGLEVVDAASGQVVGRVEDLLETGAAMVLVIRGEAGETLIPLADEFVKSVDLPAHRMVVRVPETLNA